MRLRDISMGLTVACRLAIAATGLHWAAAGNVLWAGVATIALAMTLAPVALLRDLRLRYAARVVVSILLAAHVVLGMQLALYETSVLYDKYVHMIGSGAIAGLGIFSLLRYCDRNGSELPIRLLLLIPIAGTLSVGTLWELFEYCIDRTGLFTAQRGLDDTMLDLAADLAGALLVTCTFAVSVSLRWRRARNDRTPAAAANRVVPKSYSIE